MAHDGFAIPHDPSRSHPGALRVELARVSPRRNAHFGFPSVYSWIGPGWLRMASGWLQDVLTIASTWLKMCSIRVQDAFNVARDGFVIAHVYIIHIHIYIYIATMAMVTTTAAHDNGGKRQQRRQTAAHDNNDHKRHFAAMYTINVKTRAAPLTTATKT